MSRPQHENQVFISYASEDKSAARSIYKMLSDAGVNVWFDEAQLFQDLVREEASSGSCCSAARFFSCRTWLVGTISIT